MPRYFIIILLRLIFSPLTADFFHFLAISLIFTFISAPHALQRCRQARFFTLPQPDFVFAHAFRFFFFFCSFRHFIFIIDDISLIFSFQIFSLISSPIDGHFIFISFH